jgi:putative transferase (TIGR04331 family)
LQNNLIIYPDQISIDNKFNNLFINQFCFDQFDGEKIFSSSIFSSLVNIRENRFKNFDITNSIFYKILPLVRDNLNFIHNVNFSNYSYEILLGAWLRKFIQQLVYKFFILEEVFKKEKIHSVCILDHSKYYFYTSETQTIQHATNDKLWNAHLYSAIIEYLNFKKFQFKSKKSF